MKHLYKFKIKSKFRLVVILAGTVFLTSCTVKVMEDNPPFSPGGESFGDDGSDLADTTFAIDSSGFLGLYTYIFSQKCALPACHDGSFEPDFRTIESAYNTLVYYPNIKNNSGNSFEYRVKPGDPDKSWLWERLNTEDPNLGRMPLYGEKLSASELDNIRLWILNGAENINGVNALYPTYRPTFFGFLAYENDSSGVRFDQNRANAVAPIEIPTNTMIQFWVGLYDVGENGEFIPGSDFQINEYRIAPEINGLPGASWQPFKVQPAINPFMGPLSFGQGEGPYYHSFKIWSSNFGINKVWYVQANVQDKDHSDPTLIPTTGSQSYLHTFFSFKVIF